MSAVIEVRGLNFAYRAGQPAVLHELALTVERGQRVLLVGANGAGKTTLLRVVGGKHMVDENAVRVLGRSAFHDTSLADRVELLGGSFPFNEDVVVRTLIDGVRGVDPARRRRLIEVLEVDLDWHMHRVSDGQRRRVQVLLGLLRPSEVLLLDEITTDLDVVARQDLLDFLRVESEQHGTTLVYATHIFDGMESWGTELVYLKRGRVALHAALDEIPELEMHRRNRTPAPLLRLVVDWLRAEGPADLGDAPPRGG